MFKRKLKPIQQMEAAECGVASLAMILDYHGASIPLEELRQICATSRDGNSALELVDAGTQLGLQARGLRLEVPQLADLQLPVILHWGLRHFVVLESISRQRAVIVDPASGRSQVELEEFGRRFTGIALEFRPTDQLEKRRRKSPGVAHYFKSLEKHVAAVTLVMIAGASAQVLGTVSPAVNQLLIDEVIRPVRESWLIPVFAVLVGATLVGVALQWIYQFAMTHLQTALSAALTSELGRRMLRLPLSFIEGRGRGDLMQRVATYGSLGSLLTRTALGLFEAIFALALAALMLAYDWRLAALALSIDLARVAYMRHLREDCRQRSAGELAARSREASIVLQATSMPEVVKAFGLEQRLEAWYERCLSERVGWTIRSSRLTASVGSWLSSFDGCARAGVLWYGGLRVIEGEMALGVFAGFLAIRGLMAGPLASLLDTFEGWIDFRSVLTRTDEVQAKALAPRGDRPAPPLNSRLELVDVGFRHSNGSPWIFRNVNMTVEPGRHVALTGPSGCGKSTLLRILAGVVEPSEGKVLLDGVDLKQYSHESLVHKFGTVLGDPLVLEGSARENLSLRLPGSSDQALERAARLACFDEVLARTPRGYGTSLVAHGGNLSGGERQRLGIAQALLGDPEMLFLDEATCYLDAETESRVLANVLSTGATIISVAHRPRVIEAASQVFVVHGGRVLRRPVRVAASASRNGAWASNESASPSAA